MGAPANQADMHEESIYNLVPVHKVPPARQPLYHSKVRPAACRQQSWGPTAGSLPRQQLKSPPANCSMLCTAIMCACACCSTKATSTPCSTRWA